MKVLLPFINWLHQEIDASYVSRPLYLYFCDLGFVNGMDSPQKCFSKIFGEVLPQDIVSEWDTIPPLLPLKLKIFLSFTEKFYSHFLPLFICRR